MLRDWESDEGGKNGSREVVAKKKGCRRPAEFISMTQKLLEPRWRSQRGGYALVLFRSPLWVLPH